MSATPFGFMLKNPNEWTNSEVIEAWKWMRRERKPQIGDKLSLTCGQLFRMTNVLHWNYASRPRQLSYEFESHCMICDKPYRFNVPSYFQSLVRTCEAHRGQYCEPRRYALPPAPKHLISGPGSIQRALLAEIEARDTVGQPVEQESICAELEAQGICTKGNAARALSLIHI